MATTPCARYRYDAEHKQRPPKRGPMVAQIHGPLTAGSAAKLVEREAAIRASVDIQPASSLAPDSAALDMEQRR